MTFVILTGGIDLSVGSILAFAGALAAGLLKAESAVPVVILAAIGVGALLGLANGLVITAGAHHALRGDAGHDEHRAQAHPHLHQRLPDQRLQRAPSASSAAGDLLAIPFPIIVFLLTVVVAW